MIPAALPTLDRDRGQPGDACAHVGRSSFGTCLAVAAILVALCLGGCLSRLPKDEQPVENELERLVAVDRLSAEFLIEQRVTIRWPGETGWVEERFEAALQRKGDVLLLVGFGPFRRVGFELMLEKGETTFENRTGRALPFRPEAILAEIQRVYYPWLDAGGPCSDCERSGEVAPFIVRETFVESRLRTRRFTHAERHDAGKVSIRYIGRLSPAPAGAGASQQPSTFDVATLPARVEVRNGWFGYELDIEHLRAVDLSGSPAR